MPTKFPAPGHKDIKKHQAFKIKSFGSNYFRFLRVALCLCIFVLSILLSACGDTGQFVPKVGALAQDFQLNKPDGSSVKLNEFKGKPVLLNFWATWCLPCRYEMPEIAAAYKQHQKEGLVILGVNLQEDAATIKKYSEENGYEWPMLLDPASHLKNSYNVVGYPTSIFIDRQGIIQAIYIGGMEGPTLTQQLTKIL